jgi:hypothetical protein
MLATMSVKLSAPIGEAAKGEGRQGVDGELP